MHPIYELKDPSALLSPSLLIYRAILERNLEAMIAMARGKDRLRPHVKTHKMAEIVRLTERMGIHKHKCATIAEAEMVAAAGGKDVLLAFPLVGPNIGRFVALLRACPGTTFRAVADDPGATLELARAVESSDRPIPVLIDLEVGMGRTGIAPEAAFDLAVLIAKQRGLTFDGLHAYDGHIHTTDFKERRDTAEAGIEQTLRLRERLLAAGLPVNRLVMGGTPTFPIHAALDVPGVECSPGTTTLYDVGYETRYPDLPFVPAAVLLTRVISRPRPGRLCLDLGHKAVAADPAGPRVTLLGIPEATLGSQSEEHLVVDTPHADRFPPGTPVLALPTHICPTCALHRRAYVIEDGICTGEWEVTARDRVITI